MRSASARSCDAALVRCAALIWFMESSTSRGRAILVISVETSVKPYAAICSDTVAFTSLAMSSFLAKTSSSVYTGMELRRASVMKSRICATGCCSM